MALLARLPGVAWLVVGLIGLAWFMQVSGVTDAQVGAFLGGKVVILLQLAVVLLPYAAAFVALLAAIYLATHQLEQAIAAGISAGALLLIDIGWHLGLGLWVTAHMTGRA